MAKKLYSKCKDLVWKSCLILIWRTWGQVTWIWFFPYHIVLFCYYFFLLKPSGNDSTDSLLGNSRVPSESGSQVRWCQKRLGCYIWRMCQCIISGNFGNLTFWLGCSCLMFHNLCSVTISCLSKLRVLKTCMLFRKTIWKKFCSLIHLSSMKVNYHLVNR
jgi:magnesium-transporting ATPase (P-type)